MTVKLGEEYCGEHMPSCATNSPDLSDKTLRVVCPLDRKHTCYAHKLAKHLKICNAREKESVPYIIKGINCGETILENAIDKIDKQTLRNYSVEEIKNVINKIQKLHDDVLTVEISEKILTHPLIEEEMTKPELGDKSRKHLIQTSSILGYLKEYDLIKSDTCFIEFGAGKGKLSFWMANALETVNNSIVLLIEKASLRHKMDNKLDKTNGNVQRIRADIADLVLQKVDILKNVKGIVAVTKHLCGDATDLALRCIKNYQDAGNAVCGIVMAFCCHHRCKWTEYTGKDFFSENGINRKDFDIMRGIISWATCGTGFSRDKNKEIDPDFYRNNLDSLSERDKEIGLSRHEKEVIEIITFDN
ncbi:Methyltransferase TRM13 [Popillia japonica]|uniref:tRNA:m(4)X modification enzyme TRM13 n=1 Tax=Popillia japonica TaxID=7064 RepID=A0AAW1HU24_POPJA